MKVGTFGRRGPVDERMGGTVRGGGGGRSGIFGIVRGASRRANPRLAPRVRQPAARPGRAEGVDGTEVSQCSHLSRVGARDQGIPAFAPRSEPPHARAPGAQMIRMAPGSSLASQRLSRDILPFLLGDRLAETDFAVAPSGLA
eukprot:gene18000-biopygen8373